LNELKIKGNTWLKLGLFLLAVAIYFGVAPVHNVIQKAVVILSSVDISAMKNYILSFGIWAPVVSFLLMVFQSIAAPLPAFVITFANAALFGWLKGAILSWTSAMAGAALCYWIGKFYGRSVVEKLVTPYALKRIDRFFTRYGKYAILLARLLPFISFDAVSYAAGLTAVGFWEFFWATGIGQLPATLVYSYVGGMLVGGTKMFFLGILSVVSLTIFAYIIKKMLKDKEEDLLNIDIRSQK